MADRRKTSRVTIRGGAEGVLHLSQDVRVERASETELVVLSSVSVPQGEELKVWLHYSDGTSKAVFRRALRGPVPDAILDRRDKIGFATPEHEWMPALGERVDALLTDESLARTPVLRAPELREEWRAIRERRPRRDFRAWRWLNLVEWAKRTGADFS